MSDLKPELLSSLPCENGCRSILSSDLRPSDGAASAAKIPSSIFAPKNSGQVQKRTSNTGIEINLFACCDACPLARHKLKLPDEANRGNFYFEHDTRMAII